MTRRNELAANAVTAPAALLLTKLFRCRIFKAWRDVSARLLAEAEAAATAAAEKVAAEMSALAGAERHERDLSAKATRRAKRLTAAAAVGWWRAYTAEIVDERARTSQVEALKIRRAAAATLRSWAGVAAGASTVRSQLCKAAGRKRGYALRRALKLWVQMITDAAATNVALGKGIARAQQQRLHAAFFGGAPTILALCGHTNCLDKCP
jgi:hypothetical protein